MIFKSQPKSALVVLSSASVNKLNPIFIAKTAQVTFFVVLVFRVFSSRFELYFFKFLLYYEFKFSSLVHIPSACTVLFGDPGLCCLSKAILGIAPLLSHASTVLIIGLPLFQCVLHLRLTVMIIYLVYICAFVSESTCVLLTLV